MKAKYKFEKESIASPDHFKPIRIRENLAVNYDAYYKVDKRDATFNKKNYLLTCQIDITATTPRTPVRVAQFEDPVIRNNI